MRQARVIMFGYGELALAALETLARLGIAPVAVVVPGNRTGPDVDLVTDHARVNGLTLLVQPQRRRLEPFVAELRALRPDLLLVWSYSMLLPPELIAVAPLGAVNVHGGLLPEYRGGHVMNWAIANGETETGITLARVDEGIDTGPVIAERRFAIEPEDDAASVRQKLKNAGASLLQAWWPSIVAGTAPAIAQDESRARYYRMRTPEDGRINWSRPNAAICNLVRALVSPWPGAFTTAGRTRLVVRRAEPTAASLAAAPGTVVRCDGGGLQVAAGIGDVRVLSAEVDGWPIRASDLLQLGVAPGQRLAADDTSGAR
jgi:methionyl-tRNA formyltransferase